MSLITLSPLISYGRLSIGAHRAKQDPLYVYNDDERVTIVKAQGSDLYEGYRLKIDMPGVKATDVDIACDESEGIIQIQGIRRQVIEESDGMATVKKQRYESIYRFKNPSKLDLSQLQATIQDGFLFVSAPPKVQTQRSNKRGRAIVEVSNSKKLKLQDDDVDDVMEDDFDLEDCSTFLEQKTRKYALLDGLDISWLENDKNHTTTKSVAVLLLKMMRMGWVHLLMGHIISKDLLRSIIQQYPLMLQSSPALESIPKIGDHNILNKYLIDTAAKETMRRIAQNMKTLFDAVFPLKNKKRFLLASTKKSKTTLNAGSGYKDSSNSKRKVIKRDLYMQDNAVFPKRRRIMCCAEPFVSNNIPFEQPCAMVY